MSTRRRGGLLAELADLDDPTPKDFDPEDDAPQDSDSDGSEIDGGSDNDPAAAREHYLPVGKSKLRKPAQPRLGPQYAGLRVGREEVEDEDDDDPFARGVDEQDSDLDGGVDGQEDEGEDSASASDVGGSSHDSEASDSEDGSEVTEDEDANSSHSDADSELATSVKPAVIPKLSKDDRDELRRVMSAKQAGARSSQSQGVKEDAEKGRAVKQQRTTFDNLLNIRIKLQKSLTSANTLNGLVRDKVDVDADEASAAIDRAEAAALTLWNNLSALRLDLSSARAGTKRTYEAFSLETPTSMLWSRTQSQTAAAKPFIESTLEKWFNRTHEGERLAAQSRSKFKQASVTTVHDVLSSHLSDRTRLLKRARTPRSCAPYQLAQLTAKTRTQSSAALRDQARAQGDVAHDDVAAGDSTVYDDADFYSALLSTLLEQRGTTTTPSSSSAGQPLPSTGHQIRREAKARRLVDTKASKGRKLRYAVHEKLLNFCAPDDRSSWPERQVDELFGSLFGRRVGLGEDSSDEEEEDAAMGGTTLGVEEGALLFR